MMCSSTSPREPATPEEERATEADELASFRRRRQWADEVFGEGIDSDDLVEPAAIMPDDTTGSNEQEAPEEPAD